MSGVVAVDLPISLLEDSAPRAQLGPLGYSFGINRNGLLVYHPGMYLHIRRVCYMYNTMPWPSGNSLFLLWSTLCTVFSPIGLWMDDNYLQDPAHVDLEDVEGEEAEVKQLRQGMVDAGPERQGSLRVARAIDWEARAPLGDREREYRFIGIEDADIS